MWLKSRLCVFISIHGHRHAHLFLSVLFFTPSLYFFLKSFFHLFLIPAVPDENSMEDLLCNSSFGSMVSLDYVTPDTDTIARRKLIEDQKIIMELSGRLQELQNEVNCMNDSKDFQDAESIRSGNSHVTSQPVSFPKHQPFEGMLRPSFISQRQIEEPPNIWDTSGMSGNVFAHPQTSSSAPIHGAFSLVRPLPSSFTFPSFLSLSTSSTTSCSLSSTTRSSWKACATPPQKE